MAEEIIGQFSRRFPNGPVITADALRVRCDRPSVTVLFGPSGSGKTTLLRCLAGLERPDSGTIQCGSDIWFDHSRSIDLPPQSRWIGYLSQDYALFPHLNVARNIGYGLRRVSAADRHARVSEMIRLLDLGGLEDRFPVQLSGGQQQRVALARAVVPKPKVLLLDEPLSALDSPTRIRVRSELRRWLTHLGIPALLVTHDRIETLTLGDELIVMDQGKIVQSGPVNEVFSRPGNLAVAGILSVETVVAGRVVAAADELLSVAVGNALLWALGSGLAPGAPVHVCIRAEDVILLQGSHPASSPRNHLTATIQSVTAEGPLMRIELECGFPLIALLTRQAAAEMQLKPGGQVMALIKAPQIHLIPR